MTGRAVAVLITLLGWSVTWAQQGGERRRVSSPTAFYNDADPAMTGMLNVSEYVSYYKVPAGGDLAGPSTYLNVGLHRRVDVSGGFAYVRSRFEESRINAIGDSYLGAKILVWGEGRRRPALAVNPMVEVLGRASTADNPLAPDHVNFVYSFSLQKSFDEYRVYYSGGYLSRGIVFSSVVGELNKWSRVTPVVILSHGRLTNELRLVSRLGLNRSRSDVTGGIAVGLWPNWTAFANAGRSFGRIDLNSTSYQVTGGVSFNVRLWGKDEK